MGRAFLSHSSKDKDFVKQVFELLGKDKCIYDESTFEIGLKPVDEIFSSLEDSDIFVYFISENALNSDWVSMELNAANSRARIGAGRLQQIFPIIIDNSISYTDGRIASYLKEGIGSYNLRYVDSPLIAYRKIKQQLIKLYIRQNPDTDAEGIFYGRDEELKSFKRVFDNPLHDPIKSVFVAGIEGIGRRSFCIKAFKDIGIYKSYYLPNTISLGRNETIDDLILKISDLGFASYSIPDLTAISQMDTKIGLLVELLNKVQSLNEFILIYDNSVIVNYDGIVYWFEKALKLINAGLSVAVLTSVRLKATRLKNAQFVFATEIFELNKTEKVGLLRRLGEVEEVYFERADIAFMSDCLNGYPPQIKYCVELAKENGIQYVKEHSDRVSLLSSDKVNSILNSLVEGFDRNQALGFVSFLCEYESTPVSVVYDIIKSNSVYSDVYYKMIAMTLCRMIGASNDYVIVHATIKDYVQRVKFEVPKDIRTYLKDRVSDFARNIESKQYADMLNVSELTFYLKENMKKGIFPPDRFLYSTIYLKSVVELYNSGEFNKVITIMEGLHECERIYGFEKPIQVRLQIYYCMALARKTVIRKGKDTKNFEGEFFKQIEFFDLRIRRECLHINFLKGFYYRLNGRLEEAERHYKVVLSIEPEHKQCTREIVSVYRMLEQYDLAENYARSFYRENSDNAFAIQGYFDCLVRKNSLTTAQLSDVNEMLDAILAVHKYNATNIYYQVLSQYNRFIRHDLSAAISTLNEGLRSFPNSIHLLCDLFDIYEIQGNLSQMYETLMKIQQDEKRNEEGQEPRITYRDMLLKAHKTKNLGQIEIELSKQKFLPESLKQKVIEKSKFICK